MRQIFGLSDAGGSGATLPSYVTDNPDYFNQTGAGALAPDLQLSFGLVGGAVQGAIGYYAFTHGWKILGGFLMVTAALGTAGAVGVRALQSQPQI